MAGGKTTRGKSAPKLSASDDTDSDSAFKLSFMEALADPDIIKKLCEGLKHANADLHDKVGTLTNEVQALRKDLRDRDKIVLQLRTDVEDLRAKYDALEQYGRRNNLRFQGIQYTNDENTDTTIITLVNNDLKLDPPLIAQDIDISHRIRNKHSAVNSLCPIIVRFMSHSVRNRIFRAKSKLKTGNQGRESKIFINEDLTPLRAGIAYEARQRKKKNLILDTWTYNGMIKVKDKKAKIHDIYRMKDLDNFVAGR